MKTSPILFKALVETKREWRKALAAEGIPVDSLFVVFSDKHAALNAASTRLLTLKAIHKSFEDAESQLAPTGNINRFYSWGRLTHAYEVAMREAF